MQGSPEVVPCVVPCVVPLRSSAVRRNLDPALLIATARVLDQIDGLDPQNYIETCKLRTNQRIMHGKRYDRLSKDAQNEIYYMKYCECLERGYTECLKHIKDLPGYKHVKDLTACNHIIDEYTRSSGLHTYKAIANRTPFSIPS